MKKLSKLTLQGAKLLSAKQMRSTIGGYDSYSGSDVGCKGKLENDSCTYYRNGSIHTGICKTMPFAGRICWGG